MKLNSSTSTYGSNAPVLFKMLEKDGIHEAMFYNLPIMLWVKLKYALEYEMTVTPSDFFVRRTGDMLFDIATVKKYRDQVNTFIANYYGWNEAESDYYLRELEQEIKLATTPI